MLHPPYRPASLIAAAVMALGLTAGAQAQTTDQSTTGTRATQPSTPMSKSATTTGEAKLDRSDRKFLEKAAMGGMKEVQLGELAQQKAQSDQVKEFAKRMVDDHGKANDELKQMASTKGVSLPASSDKSIQKDMQKFEKLSGAEFDREYMKHMVDDHKKDLKDFQKEAKSAKDSDVKGFAAKTLPTLQEHMKLAQTTYDAVKGAKSSASTSRSGTSTSPQSSAVPSGKGSSPLPGTSPKSTTTR